MARPTEELRLLVGFFCVHGVASGSPNYHREADRRSSHASLVDRVAIAAMLDEGRDQPTARQARLGALTRLSVRLQEAGDETAVLRALDLGLRELGLRGLAGQLDPDARGL